MNLVSAIKNFQERDFSFIITGSNGWFGKYILEILHNNLKSDFYKRVFPFSNSSSVIKLSQQAEINCVNYDFQLDPHKKYVLLHFAFLTQDKLSTNSLDVFKEKNLEIRNNITNIINKNNVVKMLYASSGAVYNQNNLYGTLKRQDEDYFSEIMAKKSAEIIIPRIFNVAGKYINKENLYVLSDFINQAKIGKSITINAESLTYRTFTHIANIFEICFSWLLDEKKAEKQLIFDVSNPNHLELTELANKIFDFLRQKPIIIRNLNTRATKNFYVGDPDIFLKLIAKYQIEVYDYPKMIDDTFQFLF